MSLISPIINREESMRVIDLITWAETYFSGKGFDHPRAEIEWFLGGKLNASYNCIDRHIKKGDGNKIAIIWEGNQPNENRTFTYNMIYYFFFK